RGDAVVPKAPALAGAFSFRQPRREPRATAGRAAGPGGRAGPGWRAIMAAPTPPPGPHESIRLVVPRPHADRGRRLLRADLLRDLQPVRLGTAAVPAVHLPAHRLRRAGRGAN